MDFSRLELEGDDARLREEVKSVIEEHLTPEVRARMERTGSYWDEGLCKALGERGWILSSRAVEDGGAGLTPLQGELLELELERADALLMAIATTRMVAPAVDEFADPDLAAEVVPGAARGEVRICLGYTEPDNGSDIAAAKTRAVRDGEEWVINGSKMFTTEAQNCQYTFLLTRTNAEVAKHKGLTMFLVPLETPGIEIAPIHTVAGERTNVVYYTDVRVPDRFRMGPVDGGWGVLMGPLATEHGDGSAKQISPPSSMGRFPVHTLEQSLDAAVRWALEEEDGRAPIEAAEIRAELAEIAIELEAAASTPDPMGRIYSSAACLEGCERLLGVIGPRAVIAAGEEGAFEDGILERAHRFAQGTSIYGGTVEIFKNMVAQQVLGLPRQLPPSR